MTPNDITARRVATTVARTGTRVVRDLIHQTASIHQTAAQVKVNLPPVASEQVAPEQVTPQQATQQPTQAMTINSAHSAADPWRLTSPAAAPPRPSSHTLASHTLASRTADLTRRGLGLLTLLGFGVLGALVAGLAVLGLGFGAAQGSVLAGGLLLLVLLLGLAGGYWLLRRASGLLKAERDVPVPVSSSLPAAPATAAQSGEDHLLTLLRQHEHRLPALPRTAFHATVIAVRDALRLTASDTALERDTFDVRQAAREDLPELLDAYQVVPRSRQSDEQLLEQLRLIEQRMQRVKMARTAARQRDLDAHGRYLKDKYQSSEISEQ